MAGFLSRIPNYWIFQAIGWGMFIITNTFFALTFDKYNTDFIGRLITFVAIGVIFSHIMRDVIKDQAFTTDAQPANYRVHTNHLIFCHGGRLSRYAADKHF